MLGGCFLGIISLLFSGEFSFILFLAGFALGMGLQIYQLYSDAKKRLRAISKRLPYALDLISLAMGAGATFTEAVRTVVRENDDEPLNVELKTVLGEIDLGTTRRKALQNLAMRAPWTT